MRKGQKTSEETKKKISQILKFKGIKPPSQKGKKRTLDTRIRLRESHLGKVSPKLGKHYSVDLNDLKKCDSDYINWMLSVKKRDNWKCKVADKNCNGRLEAHHILSWRDYKELRYEKNNGITLCHYHHPIKRAEELRLAKFFQELIKLKN